MLETLKLERDLLKAELQGTTVTELEVQEQLKIVHVHLKDHQETIDKFRESFRKKSQILNIQKDLNKSKDELQKKVCVILSFGGTCCMLNHFSRVPIFCNPMDCILPGSSVHGILQARILEWVAISFSRGFFQPRDQTVLCLLHWQAHSLPLAPPGKPLTLGE